MLGYPCLYGELGRVPLLIRCKVSMVKYWLRIAVCWDTPTLVRDAYASAQSNCTQWTQNIKTVMLLICVGPPRMCRARKNYRAAANWPTYTEQDKWTSGINWKIKDVQTYQARLQNGKLPIELAPHLWVPVAQLRTSSYPLRIEVGRYNLLPVEELVL